MLQVQLPRAHLHTAVTFLNAATGRIWNCWQMHVCTHTRLYVFLVIILYENTFSRFSKSPLYVWFSLQLSVERLLWQFLNGELLNATANVKELPVLLPLPFTRCYTYNHMQIIQQVKIFSSVPKIQWISRDSYERFWKSSSKYSGRCYVSF